MKNSWSLMADETVYQSHLELLKSGHTFKDVYYPFSVSKEKRQKTSLPKAVHVVCLVELPLLAKLKPE